MAEKSRLRIATTTFGWAMVILAVAAWFFWTAYATEVPWMERLSPHGVGTVTATSWLAAPCLLLLLAIMLVRFRGARPAALLGWAASLPLFAALFLVAYNYSYCSFPAC